MNLLRLKMLKLTTPTVLSGKLGTNLDFAEFSWVFIQGRYGLVQGRQFPKSMIFRSLNRLVDSQSSRFLMMFGLKS